VWIIGRTQTNGAADYPIVHKIQDAFRVTPLSYWGGQAPPATTVLDPGIDMVTPTLDQVNSMSAEDFFNYGLGLMKLHRPHLTDWSLIAQMRRLGLKAGAGFASLDPERAIITMVGLGANSAEDAVYPILMADADGHLLAGDNDYVLHFDKTGLPPVHAFWSVTMYDAEGFQVANSLNRFAIGDRDPLHYNADGSLDMQRTARQQQI
jgi:hypothetical protein